MTNPDQPQQLPIRLPPLNSTNPDTMSGASTSRLSPDEFMAQHTIADLDAPLIEECSVCLEYFCNEPCVQITGIEGCTHRIGRACLKHLLETRPRQEKRCPLCRTVWIVAGAEKRAAQIGDIHHLQRRISELERRARALPNLSQRQPYPAGRNLYWSTVGQPTRDDGYDFSPFRATCLPDYPLNRQQQDSSTADSTRAAPTGGFDAAAAEYHSLARDLADIRRRASRTQAPTARPIRSSSYNPSSTSSSTAAVSGQEVEADSTPAAGATRGTIFNQEALRCHWRDQSLRNTVNTAASADDQDATPSHFQRRIPIDINGLSFLSGPVPPTPDYNTATGPQQIITEASSPLDRSNTPAPQTLASSPSALRHREGELSRRETDIQRRENTLTSQMPELQATMATLEREQRRLRQLEVRMRTTTAEVQVAQADFARAVQTYGAIDTEMRATSAEMRSMLARVELLMRREDDEHSRD